LQSGGDDYPGAGMSVRRRRNYIPYIILALILAAVAFVGAEVWLNWIVLEAMYSTKAGLDWFGINFYGGLTFAVAALLALIFVNPFPRRSDVFEAFNALMGLQYRNPYMGGYSGQTSRRIRPMYIRPSRTLWAFWQFVKWLILFAIFVSANGFPGLGNITIVIDMATRGFGSWANVPRITTLAIQPASAQTIVSLIPTMEIQYWILVYFATVVMIVVAIRFFLKFVRDVVFRAGDKWIRNIFVALTAIMFAVFIQIPYWAMDIRIGYELGAVATILGAFFVLSIFYHLRSTRETIPLAERRRAGTIVAAIVIVGILLVNVGAISYYTLNWNNNWIAYEWTPLTSKQVAVTQWAAGIQNISTSSVSNIPSGNVTTTLSLIRQWDANSSYTQSQNQIGVNWLQLVPNPEIVYVYGQEYWVAPTTFSYPTANWQNEHLIYTHSSKIIVMNTHTGSFVSVDQAYHLPSQPLMYYGEDFENDVYIKVQGSPGEIENVTYSSQPDYTLCGAQRALWFLAQGQVGYALSPPQNCIEMLHDTNVVTRVQNVLISGLQVDPQTYLVTDSAVNGTSLYYAIQVYIDYPLHSAFASGPEPGGSPGSYLRLFGVVLVNIADGSMKGYAVGQADDFLTSFYRQYYPTWGPVPSWLQSQLRYPEALLGNQNQQGQLDEDFIWHVADPSTFRSGSDFFERPQSTEVLYIPFVVGNTVSFAAMQLVEFQQSPGHNLAGIYVIYGGDQLGQFNLYEANSTTLGSVPLLGPSAALNEFNSDSKTLNAITLDHAVSGNILLYPVNGHLYYFIPAYVYPQSSTGTAVTVKNPFIDVIDAENPASIPTFVNTSSSEDLTYGFNVQSPTLPTNASARTNYIVGIFRNSGYAVSNVTQVNLGAVPLSQQVNTTQYSVDSQNSTATAFVDRFITSYADNATLTGGHIVANTIYMWSPSAGTLDFGFFVTSTGVTEIYYVSIYIGT
jgi:hypothetical protein